MLRAAKHSTSWLHVKMKSWQLCWRRQVLPFILNCWGPIPPSCFRS